MHHYRGMLEAKRLEPKASKVAASLQHRLARIYLRVLCEDPSPNKLKLKLKLVFAGLILCPTLSVTAQHSQLESNLVAALKPIYLLLRMS